MKVTALFFFAARLALLGNSVDYSYSWSADLTQEEGSNQSMEFYFPQFDPTLGSLDALSFTFVDQMEGIGGYNDMGAQPPTTFTYTWSGSDVETTNYLGVSAAASGSMQVSLTNPNGGVDISGGGFPQYLTLTDAGTLSGSALAPFMGTGWLTITIAPQMNSATSDVVGLDGPESGIDGVFGGIDEVLDNASLSITYEDAAAVPEPESPSLWLAILVITLAAAGVGRQRRLLK